MLDPLEIVAVLDVNAIVAEREYRHLLAQERREALRLHLSACGAPAPQSGDGTLVRPDWAALGKAVEALAAQVRSAIESALKQGRAVEFYMVARAPLPLCAQFGAALPRLLMARVQSQVLNPRRGGTWERYPLHETEVAESPFFDVVDGMDLQRPSLAQGCVAVVVSTVGGPPREDAIAALLKERGEPLATIVQIATRDTMDVTTGNAPAIAERLKGLLSKLQTCYPHASSYGLFVAGPVPLAFALGQAINPHQFPSGALWFANFDKGRYEFALSLPFRLLGQVPIPDDAAAREARRGVLDALHAGIEELKRTLKADDLPEREEPDRRQRLLAFLRDLTVAKEPSGDAFGLSVLQRSVSFGRGLAEALRDETVEVQRRFGQLLLLHEMYHDGQALRTSDYYGVGRAGVVLEQVDFKADAFALTTLARWSLRRGGEQAREKPDEVVVGWIDAHLRGIQAFDRAEQGARLGRLYERRLRRYLAWHLQRARAETLKPGEGLYEHVEALFGGHLTVELAPLAGRLDDRFDKLVDAARSDTELFVELDGKLLRQGQNQVHRLDRMVEAVRTFDTDLLRQILQALIDRHRQLLVPWAQQSAI